VPWTDTASLTFIARHDERDAADAEVVLAQLERAREDLGRRFAVGLGELDVVLHGSAAQLDAAQPWLPVQRALTAPAARRYVVGTVTEGALHVLAPRVLARRASNVEGSLEMLMLAPAALLARRVVAANHPGLPPPLGPRGLRAWLRWAWLLEGAAQFFSGQSRHVRPAAARRLREGPPPAFPPGRADATLLGGTVFELLAREEGEAACVALAHGPHPGGPWEALEKAFPGRPLRRTEHAWRAFLERLGGPDLRPGRAGTGGSALREAAP
jgi:hypothetical protein